MITKSVKVARPLSLTFSVWTEKVDLWWPKAHRLSGKTPGTLRYEAGEGGRLVELLADGRELVYGTIVRWEPPEVIEHTFTMGTGADHPTLVTIRFEETDGATLVRIEHRAGDAGPRFGKVAQKFDTNWQALLQAFVLVQELE